MLLTAKSNDFHKKRWKTFSKNAVGHSKDSDHGALRRKRQMILTSVNFATELCDVKYEKRKSLHLSSCLHHVRGFSSFCTPAVSKEQSWPQLVRLLFFPAHELPCWRRQVLTNQKTSCRPWTFPDVWSNIWRRPSKVPIFLWTRTTWHRKRWTLGFIRLFVRLTNRSFYWKLSTRNLWIKVIYRVTIGSKF